MARRIIDLVTRYQAWVLGAAIALMTYASMGRVVPEFWRLVAIEAKQVGAVDLHTFHRIVNNWFDGTTDAGRDFLVYPPASLVTLWPFMGWLDYQSTRWLWAATTVVVLVVLVVLFVRETGARTPFQGAFVALMLLSAKPAGQTIGNGQLTLHVLAAVVGFALILCREPRGVGRDLVGALLLFASLVKPNVSAPFFWLALFAPARRWPALLVAGVYAGVTAGTVAVTGRSLGGTAGTWATSSAKIASTAGHGNVSRWVTQLGFGKYAPYASVATLLALGAFLFRYRSADLWLRIGLTAVVARLWTYHYFYDDVMLVLAMVALFRVVRDGAWSDRDRLLAGAGLVLLLCNSVALNPLQTIMPLAPFVRIGVLVLLAYLTHRSGVRGQGLEDGGWGLGHTSTNEVRPQRTSR